MKGIDEIRRDNLRIIESECGSTVAAHKLLGMSYAQFVNLRDGAKDSVTKKRRGMRPATARKIEIKAGKPEFWLDEDHSKPETELFDQNVAAVSGGARPYPVISNIQAGLLSEIKDPYPPGAGFAIEYGDDDASRWAFFLEIEGDSMEPDFKEGDRVRIDPEVTPRPGDFVAARNSKEKATFKKYRVRGIDQAGNEIFDLVPLNDNYRTLKSDEEKLLIIGTMTEHRRKYRKK